MTRINCHSAFKHYEMFHSGCHGGGNYGSIFNTTYNIDCGGHGGFWGGFGAGLGNAFGNLFGGWFGGGMNMGFGGFGNFGGLVWEVSASHPSAEAGVISGVAAMQAEAPEPENALADAKIQPAQLKQKTA